MLIYIYVIAAVLVASIWGMNNMQYWREMQKSMNHNFAIIERKLEILINKQEDMMALIDDVNARMGALEDGVKALVVHVDTLKAAYDDLKAHPVVVEDPALQGIADRIGAVTDSLAAEAGKIGASGGV